MQKIALITGATAGIGKATAIRFAENNFSVIITGRRKEKLQELTTEITQKYNVEALALSFDVRSKPAVENAINSLSDEWKKIDVLVNNAGLAAGFSRIQDGDIEDWDTMIDTNIKGLLYVSRMIMPIMIENGSGHIINIGSIAGKETYLNGNVYSATKYAVDALTQSMRIDLLSHGIRVTCICPGLVETEFSVVRYKGDSERADKIYKGFKALTAEDIADVVFFTASRPEHVNINDIVIMPTAQANTTHLIKQT